MKIIILAGLLAVTVAAPQSLSQDKDAKIIQQDQEVNIDSYKFSYKTDNGISAEEQGQLKNIGGEEPALEVQGQFSYPGDDGKTIQLSYLANENGFQPQGDHIPTPPPIPEDIQRALAYLATAKPQPEEQSYQGNNA